MNQAIRVEDTVPVRSSLVVVSERHAENVHPVRRAGVRVGVVAGGCVKTSERAEEGSTVITMKAEVERLALLRSLRLWEAVDPPELDRLTQLVAQVFDVPTVLVSLVGQDEQRFVSRVGFDARKTEREVSICSVAMQQADVLEVEDLRQDARFATNRLVTGAPGLRFYAGAPLITDGGHAIGTLCLLDYVPRRLSEAQVDQLAAFARLVMDQIALRQMVGRREAITGLLNRQQFHADISALADSGFEGTRHLVLVDILDLPAAQRLTQALGMAPVEAIIREVGLRLEDAVRSHAELYHVAVARFAFLLPSVDALDRDPLLAAVKRAVTAPVEAEGIPLQPMCHGGVVAFESTDAGDAFRKAVTATEDAIDSRCAWRTYDATKDARLRRQYRLAADVASGMERNEFYMVYQPRFRLTDGVVVGAEALVRWRHAQLGELSPSEFIPIVARTANMRTLTDWVVEQVCRQQAAWSRQGICLPVSINVAAADFDDGRLVDRVLSPCATHGIEPSRIELEITEGEWLEGRASVLDQLTDLRHAGVHIAIDDFGVGYSNFSYLYTIPLDTLKIDQALVHGFLYNSRQRAMLQGIIRLCGRIGLSVVAEGIETAAEQEGLVALDCEFGQGFHHSRPLSVEHFVVLVQSGASSSPLAV